MPPSRACHPEGALTVIPSGASLLVVILSEAEGRVAGSPEVGECSRNVVKKMPRPMLSVHVPPPLRVSEGSGFFDLAPEFLRFIPRPWSRNVLCDFFVPLVPSWLRLREWKSNIQYHTIDYQKSALICVICGSSWFVGRSGIRIRGSQGVAVRGNTNARIARARYNCSQSHGHNLRDPLPGLQSV